MAVVGKRNPQRCSFRRCSNSLSPFVPSGLPTTAKLGIDATIPEGVPKQLYRRIKTYEADGARLEDYL